VPKFACTAPTCILAYFTAMDSLLSSCTAFNRSKIKSTAEPGRDMRYEGVDPSDTLEERPDLVSIFIVYF